MKAFNRDIEWYEFIFDGYATKISTNIAGLYLGIWIYASSKRAGVGSVFSDIQNCNATKSWPTVIKDSTELLTCCNFSKPFVDFELSDYSVFL